MRTARENTKRKTGKDERRCGRLGKFSDDRAKTHEERRKGTAVALPFDEAKCGGIYTQG